MAKKGGFGGGMPGGMNMNNLLKQAQKMQAEGPRGARSQGARSFRRWWSSSCKGKR